MIYKDNNIRLGIVLLLLASFTAANAFNLSDYFGEDKPSNELAQEVPPESSPTESFKIIDKPPQAETYKAGRSEQFDQWRLKCIEAQISGKEQCNLIHQLVNDKKQQIVKIEVLKQGANNLMLFHLPMGTYLPAGAVLIVGEGAYKMPITVCMPAGCKAKLALDWNLNQQLKREDKAIVQLLNVNQQQKINIEFSLMGFSNGSKEIK